LPAIREAVTNAICHRDYGNITDIQIKIFEDSLIIWSPGLLPFDVSIDDLLSPNHSSKPRNKLIAQIFYDMGIIERYGGGIQRILDHCNADGLPTPILENSQGGFRIIFTPSLPATEGVSEGANGGVNGGVIGGVNGGVAKEHVALIKIIEEQPGINSRQLAEQTREAHRTVERWIKQLKDGGKIEFRGAAKTGGYYPTTP